jgi:hypothetical protein
MAVGTNGFFMMNNGTGELALPGGLPLPVNTGLNLVTGYYTAPFPTEDVNTLISLSVKKTLPQFMSSGIKGMYASVNLNATPFDKGFDYGIEDVANVSCKATVGAAYEYRNYLNFNSLTNIEVGSANYAYAGFDASGEAKILGIGVSGSAHLDFQASVESGLKPQIGFNMESIKSTVGKMSMVGCASATASFKIGACLLDKCLGGTVSKSVSAIFGIENASPKLSFQFESCGNGMPAMKLNDSGY